jgi:hypothetical protein
MGPVRVVESSLAYRGAHVRIYQGIGEPQCVHMSVKQAKAAVAALQAWIADAEEDALIEPANGE